MIRAAETKFVIQCCANVLRTTLPVLYSELEKCQKSLEGYLEQKKRKIPQILLCFWPSSTCNFISGIGSSADATLL